MRRRPLVAVSIAAALVLAAGVAAWLVLIRDDPDPVEIEDVVAGLEGESGAGVYVYETEGGESVDALPIKQVGDLAKAVKKP